MKKTESANKYLLRAYRGCSLFDVLLSEPDRENDREVQVFGPSNNLCYSTPYNSRLASELNKAIERAKEWVNNSQKEEIDSEEKAAAAAPRYSDDDLAEFKAILDKKMEAASLEAYRLSDQIAQKEKPDYQPGEGESPEEKENLHKMLVRQRKFIGHLESALTRIENKTYGICRVTGKLIDKNRLIAVPHATLSIEAKQQMGEAEKNVEKPAKKKGGRRGETKKIEEAFVSNAADQKMEEALEKKFDQEETPSQEKLRTCRVCGCTDDNCQQCIEKTGSPCHWVEEDLCSACVEEPQIKVTDERASTIAQEKAAPAAKEEAPAIEPQETNFFSQLLALAKPGKVDVSLRIMEVNGKLTVSFMPKDKSTNLPVNCTATAEAFDKDFFKQIIPQVKEIPDLITHNIEEVKNASKTSGRKEEPKKSDSSTTAASDSKSTPAKKKKWTKPKVKKKPGQNSNVTAKKQTAPTKTKSAPAPKKKPVAEKKPYSPKRTPDQRKKIEAKWKSDAAKEKKGASKPIEETKPAVEEPTLF